ncbi:PREDICTED: protein LURP-one-related 15-like [Camelina sativa]|uniref:Protein LURP-one-related 15-like n=1 Tax=Camelina sativa TaxID=90675 RepID=A0ABM0SUL2_CAMSA|nr:PREDICTED: protein LURP-one-related 15-like [Camelina sativa]
MQQPYVYAYPQGAGASAPSTPQPQAGVIVDPKYCSPHPVDLAIVRKLMKVTDGNFAITNVDGNLLFNVKQPLFSLHENRILLDGSETQVLTLQRKMMSRHDRWQVFRGGSTDQGDLLYRVKRSPMREREGRLDVFLPHNKDEKICDFKVKANRHERCCVVYAGESDDAIVAKVHEKHTVRSVFLGKDSYSVTVYPNVDYAFVASLIVIFAEAGRL